MKSAEPFLARCRRAGASDDYRFSRARRPTAFYEISGVAEQRAAGMRAIYLGPISPRRSPSGGRALPTRRQPLHDAAGVPSMNVAAP